MAKLRIKYFGSIAEGFGSEDGFIDFSKSTLSIGARELEKVPSQNYLQCTVCNPFILLWEKTRWMRLRSGFWT